MNLLEIMLYNFGNIDNDTKKIICKVITNEKIEMSIIYEKIYDNNGNKFALKCQIFKPGRQSQDKLKSTDKEGFSHTLYRES